ncbi:uncharacterized protein V1516DRAFT_652483 [Lipomyces oligophaga]|uniref:uncharacterized protein n=1 Tax=Lipomyces oligophaga TaxID=45792 RepID=UPI0034CEDFEC
MSRFYDDIDPEVARMRQLIAADYTDSESAGTDDFMDVDDQNAVDPALRGDTSRTSYKPGRGKYENGNEINLTDNEDEDSEADDIRDEQSDRQENDNEDDFYDDLRRAAGFKSRQLKKKKKKRGTPREQEPSEEVKILLGQANQAYATNDLDEAEKILAEVIRIDHNVYAAWKTLGEIHKQRGDISKCLLAWILAAHLRLKDAELWSICGKLSFQINQIDQALYCYNRAILANSNDVEAIFERGLIFKELGTVSKALEAFKKLHDMLPNDLTVIRELASVYVLQRNIRSAAKLYEDILFASRNPEAYLLAHPNKSLPPPFGWSQLNILAELYGEQEDWMKAIRLIKTTSRWLQNRSNERFWDDMPEDNDDEFDPDRAPLNRHFTSSRKKDSEAVAEYSVPLDIRAKLIIYRLKLGNIEAALNHAKFVLNLAENIADGQNAHQYGDLFIDVANALLEAEQYEQALVLYLPIAELDQYSTPAVILSMGRCLHGLRDFAQAETAFKTVIANDENNLDARIALAEVYEATGRRQEALELVHEVMRFRKEQEHASTTVTELMQAEDKSQEPDGLTSQQDEVMSFIPNADSRSAGSGSGRPRTNPASRQRPTRAERMQAEEIAAKVVATKWKRLRQYQEGLKSGNMVAITEWSQTASELVDMFINIKAFFPSDRQRLFRGFFVAAKKRAGRQTMNDRLRGMESRLQESLEQDISDEKDNGEQNATEFRGVPFDDWFSLFMQYALTLTWHEEVEDAYSVLSRARDANVFFQDKLKLNTISFVQLSCALHVSDYKLALDTVRNIIAMQDTQFNPEMYKLFLCALPGGQAAVDIFNLAQTQKYLLRHVKGIDSIIQKCTITGAIKVDDSKVDSSRAETESSVLLILYGQILASSRSHVPSLSYYMRAFAISPKDPMLLLSIGLAHIHRAIQRLTDNRHLQIIEGMSYLMDYYEIRLEATIKSQTDAWVEAQEVNYNLGRAFQMLGLHDIATKYYERALKVTLPTSNDVNVKQTVRAYNLRLETAYNLQWLYMMSGNFQYARSIVDTYLVV